MPKYKWEWIKQSAGRYKYVRRYKTPFGWSVPEHHGFVTKQKKGWKASSYGVAITQYNKKGKTHLFQTLREAKKAVERNVIR